MRVSLHSGLRRTHVGKRGCSGATRADGAAQGGMPQLHGVPQNNMYMQISRQPKKRKEKQAKKQT
jgi:hypothetical protein